MSRLRPREVVIVGSGPAGCICALECSKRIPTTIVIQRTSSGRIGARVDSVAASLLTLLLDFGIHPKKLGVTTLHKSRQIAWESPRASEHPIPASAYIERELFDKALLDLVAKSGRVKIVSFTPELLDAVLRASAMNQVHLVDATGRKSTLAEGIVKPAKTWAARAFLVERGGCDADPKMRIAALPDGFVYRFGSSRNIAVGLVGRYRTVAGTSLDVERYLRQNGAGWILEGVPSLAYMLAGSTSTASVQWRARGAGLPVGDAALARDPLSGQGLSAAISDSLYTASALCNGNDLELLNARREEQRHAHLQTLVKCIDACRHRHEHVWSDYSGFLRQKLETLKASSHSGAKVVLRSGKLTLRSEQIEEVLSA